MPPDDSHLWLREATKLDTTSPRVDRPVALRAPRAVVQLAFSQLGFYETGNCTAWLVLALSGACAASPRSILASRTPTAEIGSIRCLVARQGQVSWTARQAAWASRGRASRGCARRGLRVVRQRATGAPILFVVKSLFRQEELDAGRDA